MLLNCDDWAPAKGATTKIKPVVAWFTHAFQRNGVWSQRLKTIFKNQIYLVFKSAHV